MRPKRLLVAVDGSTASREAAELALSLVEGAGEGAEVTFLHVRPRPEDPFDGAEAPTQEQLAAGDEVLREALELARDRGVAVEVESAVGDGTDEIVDTVVGIAAGREADLIVVGSRGRGALAGAVLGSVSLGVLRYSEKPVLVVKGRTQAS